MTFQGEDNQYTESDELRIIDRARQGDRASFDILVERYGPRIYSMIVHAVGNREDAEDFTQETFIRIYRALPKFRGDSPIFTWMYRIAINIVGEMYRKRRNRPLVLTDTDIQEIHEHNTEESILHSGATEDLVASRERLQAVYDALARIPEPFRKTLELFAIEGLSHQEIADICQTIVGTVKTRLYRARQLFRREFYNENGNLER